MNQSLFQIDEKIKNVLAEADEDGCFDLDKFDSLQIEKKTKQQNVIKFVRHLKNDQDVIKKEIDRLKKLKTIAANREKWLLEYLGKSMEIDGIDKLDFTTDKAAFRKNPVRVVIDTEEKVPEKYKKKEITYKIDKEELKKDLKAGDIIAGCRLEQTQRLQIT
jgi:hypothetical protein